jgi:hypothetical protein
MFWLTLIGGCDREPETPDPVDLEPTGCDPLVPEVCAFPFPSDLFTAPDPSTPTGLRLAYGPATLPKDRYEAQVSGDLMNRFDGYSILTPILTYFADVSLEGTIPVDDLGRYLAADAKTVVVDAETGERVPHWVELDSHARSDDVRALMLRTAAPLAHGRRYVVGLRGLQKTSGGSVDVSEAFVDLRDGRKSSHPDVVSRVERFDDVVFPTLEAAGFPRSELQLAWDFTTGSRETSLGPALSARDAALAAAADGVPYQIESVEDADCSVEGTQIARTIYGRLTTARYTDLDVPGGRLVLDDQGQVVQQGETSVRFLVRVPCSIANDPGQGGRVLQYGHGLLGDLGEAEAGYLSEMANRYRYVVFAMTWTGMSTFDAPFVALMLTTDPSDFPAIPERTAQGFSEWVVGLDLATGALAADPALEFQGVSAIDTSATPVYYGNSQGAILGGAYLALSPRIERGVLGVGGMPYSLLLARSADFEDFLRIFQEKFPDDRDTALLIGAFQTVWDMGESSGYASIMDDPLPGTPPKRALLQVAEGDAQVTTLGAAIQARAWGMSTLEPAIRDVWGLDEVRGPVDGSALVEWRYTDGSAEPLENLPPDKAGDTHECPRREPEAQDQLHTFLETGRVEQTCVGGPCVGTRAGFCD